MGSLEKIPKCPFTCQLNKPSHAKFTSSHSAASSEPPNQKSRRSISGTVTVITTVGSTAAETTGCADKGGYLLSKLSEDKSGTEDIIFYKYYFLYPIIQGIGTLRILKSFTKDNL